MLIDPHRRDSALLSFDFHSPNFNIHSTVKTSFTELRASILLLLENNTYLASASLLFPSTSYQEPPHKSHLRHLHCGLISVVPSYLLPINRPSSAALHESFGTIQSAVTLYR